MRLAHRRGCYRVIKVNKRGEGERRRGGNLKGSFQKSEEKSEEKSEKEREEVESERERGRRE